MLLTKHLAPIISYEYSKNEYTSGKKNVYGANGERVKHVDVNLLLDKDKKTFTHIVRVPFVDSNYF